MGDNQFHNSGEGWGCGILSISILRRRHPGFALEEAGEGSLLVEAEGKGDVADGVDAAAQQHLGLQDEAAVEPLHHRLAAVLLDDCRQAVGREAELVGVESAIEGESPSIESTSGLS